MDENTTVKVDGQDPNVQPQEPAFASTPIQPVQQVQFNQQNGMPNNIPSNAIPNAYNPQNIVNQANQFNQPSPTSMSMALDSEAIERKSKSKNKNSNTPLLITLICLVAVLIIVGIILIITMGKKNRSDDKTEATTEQVATTEATTEAPATPTVPTTPELPQAPTQLGTSWKDYNFSFGGVIHQIPLPYAAVIQLGWTIEDEPETVSSGNFEEVRATFKDGSTCYLYFGNPTASAVPFNQSYLLGININTRWNDINSDFVLPGNITLNKSTLQDVKTAYGTPSDYSAYDDGSSATYIGDNLDDGLDMTFDVNGVLTEVTYIRAEVKDQLPGADAVSDEVPAINAQYKQPTGASTSTDDGILSIDGKYYKMPMPLSEFLNDGWELDIMSEEVIYGDNYVSTYISKGETKLSVIVENLTSNAIKTENGIVTSIRVEDYWLGSMKIVFPGNITIGSSSADVKGAYSKYGDHFYPYEDSEYYSNYYVSMYLDEDMNEARQFSATVNEEDKVSSMEYEYSSYKSFVAFPD